MSAASAGSAGASPPVAWWVWPAALFLVTFLMGTVAVVGGLGGGTLYVPIVGGFFPFHLDFVRAAGLFVALAGALAAGPDLLRANLADLRLALPLALVASSCAIVGALLGLALPAPMVQSALGATVLLIVVITLKARRSSFPKVPAPDTLASALGIRGSYFETSLGREVDWTIHRTPLGLVLFSLIGLVAGMFGIGAGWANVAALNLVLGAPLKVAVGTSILLLSVTDTSAAWVYLNEGAVLPMVVVPSMMGMMLGSRVGVRLLATARPETIRWVIVVLLLFAGLRAFLRGLGVWR